MKKVIEVCTRVEGHGNVNIYLDNQNENISQVDFEIDVYRGFENILLKKQLSDVPRIVSRVCGLCHASQSIASCKAIENIYQIEPLEQSVFLRRLLMTGELIKSHCMHLFFQSFPDLLTIFNIWNKTPSLYDLINYNPQLTTNFYDLIKIGNEIDKLFGGRGVHLIAMIPGGLIYVPSQKNIVMAQKYFQKVIFNVEWIIEKFIELFSNRAPPEDFALPNPTFLGLHNDGTYDRYLGVLGIKQILSTIENFSVNDYMKYFYKDTDLRGINFYKGKNMVVGPLARNALSNNYGSDKVAQYLSNFDENWKRNILYTNFLKLVEIYIEAHQGLEILGDPILNNKEALPSLKNIKNNEGIGVVEAPRGTLLHHYRLNENNSIDQVKLFIATEINLPMINTMITNYAQKLYEKRDISEVKEKVQRIIRAFDPCISCATH